MLDKKLYYLLIMSCAVDYVQAAQLPLTTIRKLTEPIIFNKSGVHYFFMEQFNNPDYGEHILSTHFGHLAHFLSYSKTIDNSCGFITTVFDIFHTRLKQAHWVNALSLSLLLEHLPIYLEHLCTHDDQNDLNQAIKDILYKRFISRFTKFSQNPMDGINTFDTFLSTIDELIDPTAAELSELIIKSKEKHHIKELQQLVSRFIESALEKIIWNPKSQHDSWTSVCLLAEQIQSLYDKGIINSVKTINHLYWTLVHRYAYFLRSSKHVLTDDVFDYLKKELAHNSYDWLSVAETEQLMTTKKDYLMYILWECIADKQLQQTHSSY